MSVAFTREESAETAAEVELPDRPISPHANLVTASGLEALANAMGNIAPLTMLRIRSRMYPNVAACARDGHRFDRGRDVHC
jgi:hypothetical protein